eukprot:TRINITY_DN11027_c0_g1_i1.p1 TRINITY_DN11027_c0_g1~~TRINITY_DN11027_c0_g1_i1.p1  ORF type:complete len:188 (-),score=51.03 TRINITY_DN11027_c0_g1_i1:33-554(-)
MLDYDWTYSEKGVMTKCPGLVNGNYSVVLYGDPSSASPLVRTYFNISCEVSRGMPTTSFLSSSDKTLALQLPSICQRELYVKWIGPSATSWIGLYNLNQSGELYDWLWARPANGSAWFNLPNVPGEYQAVLYADEAGSIIVGVSPTVTISTQFLLNRRRISVQEAESFLAAKK